MSTTYSSRVFCGVPVAVRHIMKTETRFNVKTGEPGEVEIFDRTILTPQGVPDAELFCINDGTFKDYHIPDGQLDQNSDLTLVVGQSETNIFIGVELSRASFETGDTLNVKPFIASCPPPVIRFQVEVMNKHGVHMPFIFFHELNVF